jgi:diguanylate cyclase (GGDEF)-like protein
LELSRLLVSLNLRFLLLFTSSFRGGETYVPSRGRGVRALLGPAGLGLACGERRGYGRGWTRLRLDRKALTTQMVSNKSQNPDARADDRELEIRLLLRRADRRNLWQAVLVIVLLLGAVVLSLPKFLPENDSSLSFQLTPYVQGLLGLLLIFTIYALHHQRLFKLLRNQLAAQLEAVTEQRVRADNLYELAVLDPLTGLYNRRFVEERLRVEIARAERYRDPLMVLLLDLDDFKKINDRFGHAAGDLVLKEVAHRIRKAVRASDFAVRMGGDEFLVLLPECPPESVKFVLSRLAPFDMDFGGEKASISSSKGYAQYRQGETVEQLVGRADEALYVAKATPAIRNPQLPQIPSNETTVTKI